MIIQGAAAGLLSGEVWVGDTESWGPHRAPGQGVCRIVSVVQSLALSRCSVCRSLLFLCLEALAEFIKETSLMLA